MPPQYRHTSHLSCQYTAAATTAFYDLYLRRCKQTQTDDLASEWSFQNLQAGKPFHPSDKAREAAAPTRSQFDMIIPTFVFCTLYKHQTYQIDDLTLVMIVVGAGTYDMYRHEYST
jgi:hypothetical protein